MIGDRLTTKAAADGRFDVFATKSADGLVKVIAGTRGVKGPYDIQLDGLKRASISAATYRFDWAGPTGEIVAPVAPDKSTVNVDSGMVSDVLFVSCSFLPGDDLSMAIVNILSGHITISGDPATNATAYAYEISGAK